jgi:hypothetical protein
MYSQIRCISKGLVAVSAVVLLGGDSFLLALLGDWSCPVVDLPPGFQELWSRIDPEVFVVLSSILSGLSSHSIQLLWSEVEIPMDWLFERIVCA